MMLRRTARAVNLPPTSPRQNVSAKDGSNRSWFGFRATASTAANNRPGSTGAGLARPASIDHTMLPSPPLVHSTWPKIPS
jgi:hypothetical protein